MSAFIGANPFHLAENITRTEEKIVDIMTGIVTSIGGSALWFYASAGMTILSVAVLMLLKSRPRGHYEWGVVAARITPRATE